MTVRVKICGLTRRSDVESAIKSGADALGFIFGYPSSPRNLDLMKLKELLAIVPPFVSAVVVSPESNTQLQKVAEMKPSFSNCTRTRIKFAQQGFHQCDSNCSPRGRKRFDRREMRFSFEE